MNVFVAEHAGFCSGVKRAVQMAEDSIGRQKVRSLGPLIHNTQEVDRLKKRGIICDEESVPKTPDENNEAVLIRSHGVGPQVIADLKARGWQIIDATCPFVRRVQQLAHEAAQEGYQVIILGNNDHAEVKGLQDWTGNTAIVAASIDELKGIQLAEKVAVLSQTTEHEAKFEKMVEYLQTVAAEVKPINTICASTKKQQDAAVELASVVSTMIVIGGRHSSNTNKLWEVCKKVNPNTYLIEEAQEIRPEWLKNSLSVGITAGASTPEWIIEEAVMIAEQNIEKQADKSEMAEEQLDLDMNDGLLDFKNHRSGDVVRGKVIRVNADEVLVDIGGKSEGIISADELSFRRVDPRDVVTVGQDILVEVIKEDREGNTILSHKRARVEEELDKLEKAKESQETVTAPVIEVVKGGLLVDVGIRGFVPASQIDRVFVSDLNQYLKQPLRMRVLELDRNARKAILSQKAVLEEEYRNAKKALWEEIQEGQTRKGKVMRIANYGAFVDLGGIDGLLHVSEMAWGHIKNPADVVAEGDEIEVYVLQVDPAKQKISLSLKGLIKNPWEAALDKYPVGAAVEGKVSRIAPFGAFIELEPGLDGLVHISQISANKVNKVDDVLKIGQAVCAKVIENDPEKKRLSLSLKEITEENKKEEYEAFLGEKTEGAGATIGDLLKESGKNS